VESSSRYRGIKVPTSPPGIYNIVDGTRCPLWTSRPAGAQPGRGIGTAGIGMGGWRSGVESLPERLRNSEVQIADGFHLAAVRNGLMPRHGQRPGLATCGREPSRSIASANGVDRPCPTSWRSIGRHGRSHRRDDRGWTGK
jgi:hypothetical protein